LPSYDAAVTGRSWYLAAMRVIPLDEGYRDRRRVGAFWVEESDGLIWFGDLVVIAVIGLYILAAVFNGA